MNDPDPSSPSRPGARAPEIAVVIATRDRETRLAFALEALAEQTLERGRYEVVVVRDPGVGPGYTPAPDGLDVKFMFGDHRPGPTPRRNLGWRASRAPLIAFTDDDCRPRADWLERLLAAAAGSPGAVLQGVTTGDPDEMHLWVGFSHSRNVGTDSHYFETCNIAYPRQVLERLGGFDEDFVFGGEDTDLGLRARAAGIEHRFVPDAVVHHAVLAIPPLKAIEAGPQPGSEPLVIARHPEQRRAIFLRVFTRDYHAYVVLALAGFAISRFGRGWRRLLWIPALLPWANKRTRVVPRRPRRLVAHLLYLSVRWVADVAETVGAARSAIRHRALVL